MILAVILALLQDPTVAVEGHVGWDGLSPAGRSAPAWITLCNSGKDRHVQILLQWGLSGLHQDPRNISFDRLRGKEGLPYILTWSLPKTEGQRIYATVDAPSSTELSLWAFVIEKRSLLAAAELRGRINLSRRLIIGVAGRIPFGLNQPDVFDIYHVRPSDLPEAWPALTSLDALVWTNASIAQVTRPAQQTALATGSSPAGASSSRATTPSDSRILSWNRTSPPGSRAVRPSLT